MPAESISPEKALKLLKSNNKIVESAAGKAQWLEAVYNANSNPLKRQVG